MRRTIGPDYLIGRLRRWVYIHLDRLTAALAQKLIAVSSAIASDLIRRYGISRDNVVVVENGIDVENIKTTLEKYGSSLDNVFKCTVMITDMKEWPLMNEVYVTYFKKDRLPARSAVGANGLALGAKVEIECLATVDK